MPRYLILLLALLAAGTEAHAHLASDSYLRIEIGKLGDAAQDAGDPGPSEPTGAPSIDVSRPSTGPSPFVHRYGRVGPVSAADDPELAEYNSMLAALAARDRENQD